MRHLNRVRKQIYENVLCLYLYLYLYLYLRTIASPLDQTLEPCLHHLKEEKKCINPGKKKEIQ